MGSTKLTIKELPPEERPRERLVRCGEESLSSAELLGIIIKEGTASLTAVQVGQRLLAEFGELRALASASVAELCRIEGIGPAKAATLKAVFALAKRYAAEASASRARFSSSSDIFHHFHTRLRDLKKEVFMAVLLDCKNRMIKEVRISEGSLTASIVHPREVFNPAIRESAAAVIFVHNHPSGDPTPSREDLEATERLASAGKIIGIKVLDHVIVGNQAYVSFADQGLL